MRRKLNVNWQKGVSNCNCRYVSRQVLVFCSYIPLIGIGTLSNLRGPNTLHKGNPEKLKLSIALSTKWFSCQTSE